MMNIYLRRGYLIVYMAGRPRQMDVLGKSMCQATLSWANPPHLTQWWIGTHSDHGRASYLSVPRRNPTPTLPAAI